LDVRDESDRNGLRIVIDIRKDANDELILNYFYKNTDLQIYYNYNNVAIIDKRPVQVGLLGLLDAFIDFRKDVVLRRSRYELNKMESRCHIIEGLMKAVSILDEIIAEIRASKDKADSKKRIMEKFGFDDTQAEAIVSLRLYRLSNTDIMELRNEFAELVNQIEETKSIIENENILKSVIVKELRSVKDTYGDDRRTKLEDNISEIVIDKTSMIQSEKVMVTVSRDGYVKRVSMRSYTASEGTLTGKKEGDELIGSISCDTLDTLLLFTSKGNYAYLPVWQIEEAKWKDMGMHLNKVIRIDGDDKIRNVILVNRFDTYAWILTISSNGQIKKTPVKEWPVQRNSRVLPAMNLAPNAELMTAFVGYEGQDVVLVSKDGYAAKYPLTDIPSTGVKSKGVKGLNLAKGDILTSACAVDKDTSTLLFLTKVGGMKRVKLADIQEGNRPVKGSLIAKRIKSNPQEIIYTNTISAYDVLHFFDGKEEQDLKASDIPLKATDTTFASPIELTVGWYKQKGIDECRIIDKPQNAVEDEVVHEDVERISLFDDEEDA
jgi:topoisomerase IV subunit A